MFCHTSDLLCSASKETIKCTIKSVANASQGVGSLEVTCPHEFIAMDGYPVAFKGVLQGEPRLPFSHFSMLSWGFGGKWGGRNRAKPTLPRGPPGDNGPVSPSPWEVSPSPLNSTPASKSLSSSGSYDSNDLEQMHPLCYYFSEFLSKTKSSWFFCFMEKLKD